MAADRVRASFAKQQVMATIGAELGIYVECQRDPRGAPIKLWTGRQNESENAPGVRLLGVMMGGRS